MKQNNLDEMQEQKLLKIEHNGFWLGFWALLTAIMMQLLFFRSMQMIAGELLVFFGLCIYMLVDCLRNGLWDRRLKADRKTNFLASLSAAGAVFLFDLAFCAFSSQLPVKIALLVGIFASLLTFFLTFGILTVCTKLYQKRRNSLEQE